MKPSLVIVTVCLLTAPVAASPKEQQELTVAIVGDTLPFFSRSTSEGIPGFERVARVLREATVAMTNVVGACCIESGHGRPVAREEDPIFIGTRSAEMPPALKWLGFDAVSLASDHTLDYSEEGMFATRAAFDRVGIAAAGAGRDAGDAGAPVYLRTPRGTVALIGVYLGPTRTNNATASRADFAGRPGANMLRVEERMVLDGATFSTLSAALAKAGYGGKPGSDRLDLIDDEIVKSDHVGFDYTLDANDVRRVTQQVRDARLFADFVVVSVHCRFHETPDGAPSPAFQQAAHVLVDAGAGAVIGHGRQSLRGIQLYKGAPIFYDLGSFIKPFDGGPQPATVYERFGQPTDGSLAELYKAMLLPWAKRAPVYESVVVVLHVDPKGVRSFELRPIDLGVGADHRAIGFPAEATPQHADQILQRLAKMSSPLGTTIQLKDHVGTITLR